MDNGQLTIRAFDGRWLFWGQDMSSEIAHAEKNLSLLVYMHVNCELTTDNDRALRVEATFAICPFLKETAQKRQISACYAP